MTSAPPAHFSLFALATGLVLALACIATGVVRLVRSGLVLRRRIEGYKHLPFSPALAAARAGGVRLSRRMETVPATVARAERALATIASARTSLLESAALVRASVAAFFTRR